MPYGGWWAIPPVAGNGWMILGDSAGFVNSARLKGIHLAIKSGMLAAETAFEALTKDDSSAATLGGFQRKVESSWIKEELWKVRNLHQGFEHGMYAGLLHTGLQMITGGRGLRNRYPAKAGYEHMSKLADLPANGGAEAHLLGPAKGDGKLTFDKLTDLYHSGTKHEEDQPAHLVIHDTNICNTRCVKEFGSPCQNFCPANVYEMVEDASQPNGKRISLNPSNCVHCKTCDIADPYQIITWVPPEGGCGPNYDGMCGSRVGTAALGCRVERSSTVHAAWVMPPGKNFFATDSRGSAKINLELSCQDCHSERSEESAFFSLLLLSSGCFEVPFSPRD